MQACRRLLIVLIVLLLHQLVLLGLSLGSLFLLAALRHLLLDGLLIVVSHVGSGLALASLLDLATLGLSGLALLQNMSVRFEWTDGVLTYRRRSQVGDVLARSLARLLDLLLLLVDHDLARLHGAALGEVELRPRNRTSPGDDLEEETDLYGVSWSSAVSVLLMISRTFSASVQPLAAAFSAMVDDVDVDVTDLCMRWMSSCGCVVMKVGADEEESKEVRQR